MQMGTNTKAIGRVARDAIKESTNTPTATSMMESGATI